VPENGQPQSTLTPSPESETDAFWGTRIAQPEDLAVGRLAFCQAESYEKTIRRVATHRPIS
jgi:hypothetical protein